MVNPIQITQPQAYSGGADFSPLSKLYDVYKTSQERARQETALGQLGEDPIANARILAQSGTLPLAQLGIGMQDKEITRRREDIAAAQAQQNWQQRTALEQAQSARAAEELKIRQAQEGRAVRKDVEDTPEARAEKLTAVGVDPKDPNYREYLVTGQNPPNIVQQQQAAKAKYEFEQAQKYDTMPKRLAAATEGELDRKDPAIARWIALGGDPPDLTKGRLGIGAPLFIQHKDTGEVKAVQLRNDQPYETPEGWTLLGPGQVAEAKAKGKVTGEATGKAVVALPKLVDTAVHQATLLDEILTHPGRMWATGALAGAPDWALRNTPGAGFRARFGQINAGSFLGIYDQLRGAGQITNTEGDKGTSAVNRMNAATSEKEFDDAAKDVKAILKTGVERAQRAAKGDFSLHPKELQDLQTKLSVGTPGAPTAPAAGGKPSLGDLIPLK